MADDLQTETPGILVFRCDLVRAKLTLSQCSANWRLANEGQPENAPRKGSGNGGQRMPHHECIGCPRGQEHVATGKFQNGIRTEVLVPAARATAPTATKVVMHTKSPTELAAAKVRRIYDELGGFNAYKKADDRRVLREAVEEFCQLAPTAELARLTGIEARTIREWRRLEGEAPTELTKDLAHHPDVVELRMRIDGLRALHGGRMKGAFPHSVRDEVVRLMPLFQSQRLLADAIGLTQSQVSKLCPVMPTSPEAKAAAEAAAKVIADFVQRTSGVGHRSSQQQSRLRELLRDFVAEHGTLVLLSNLTDIGTSTLQRWLTLTTTDERQAVRTARAYENKEILEIREAITALREQPGYTQRSIPRELKERAVRARFDHLSNNAVAARLFGISLDAMNTWIGDYEIRQLREKNRLSTFPPTATHGVAGRVEEPDSIEEVLESAERAVDQLERLASGSPAAASSTVPPQMPQTDLGPVGHTSRPTAPLSQRPPLQVKQPATSTQVLWHAPKLREGLFTRLLLPEDLTREEAERLKAFIDLLVV